MQSIWCSNQGTSDTLFGDRQVKRGFSNFLFGIRQLPTRTICNVRHHWNSPRRYQKFQARQLHGSELGPAPIDKRCWGAALSATGRTCRALLLKECTIQFVEPVRLSICRVRFLCLSKLQHTSLEDSVKKGESFNDLNGNKKRSDSQGPSTIKTDRKNTKTSETNIYEVGAWCVLNYGSAKLSALPRNIIYNKRKCVQR